MFLRITSWTMNSLKWQKLVSAICVASRQPPLQVAPLHELPLTAATPSTAQPTTVTARPHQHHNLYRARTAMHSSSLLNLYHHQPAITASAKPPVATTMPTNHHGNSQCPLQCHDVRASAAIRRPPPPSSPPAAHAFAPPNPRTHFAHLLGFFRNTFFLPFSNLWWYSPPHSRSRHRVYTTP